MFAAFFVLVYEAWLAAAGCSGDGAGDVRLQER